MVSSGLTIRSMRWWDVETLLPAERSLFGLTGWTAEMFWSELAHPENRWYIVAFDNDGLVGYAGVLLGGAEADVQTIAVLPAAQGRGVGRALLWALVGRAAESGASSLLLEVRADNAAAIALYASAHFERISVRRKYYQPGDVDAWIMRRRPLPAP